ncbi:hypothetical protein [Streptomyces sp. 3211]|uniref:hypothetical protein n=1 Tax=Streptomyces sp. 3211 TaxID=1964449 RepID=UPI001331ADA0|nr:hypothetical protein [Streptomyces sp. 3211]
MSDNNTTATAPMRDRILDSLMRAERALFTRPAPKSARAHSIPSHARGRLLEVAGGALGRFPQESGRRHRLDAGQPFGTEIREVAGALRPLLEQSAKARHGVPLAGGRAAPANAGDAGHELLGLGLPAPDQDAQAQALRPPMQGQEVEQAVGVHGRRAVQVDHEVR